MFWKWLEEEGLVEGRLVLRRTLVQTQPTPLALIPTPEEILAWRAPTIDLRLLLLIIYLFSIRPQEAFALTPSLFLAGHAATLLEASKVMKNSGLFDHFVVRINHQRSRRLGLVQPKAGSRRIVACFNQRAAESIVEILKTRHPTTLLFPFGNDYYYHTWKRLGIPRLSLIDCRRASLYWLGHYSKLDLVSLRNHARHADIKTTALYTRRPIEEFEVSENPLSLW